jgi:hypothetical protein
MKELDEVAAIERSAQEEEQAAELVLRQRDCIHAGLSYQLTQVSLLWILQDFPKGYMHFPCGLWGV